jgi:c-di-GMP-binding flagellar brake protein YcgR
MEMNMKESKKAKFVTEHELQEKENQVRLPFKVTQDTRRRFVRVEITSPLYLQRIKGADGGFWPDGQGQPIAGTILNISLGGVLVDLEHSVKHGDIVTLRFNLQGEVILQKVLGLVKRSEESEGKFLTGIEFVDREKLADRLTSAELDVLSDEIDGLDDNVRKVLKNYIEK